MVICECLRCLIYFSCCIFHITRAHRSVDLLSLTELLNADTPEVTHLFSQSLSKPESFFESLVDIIFPWVVAEPPLTSPMPPFTFPEVLLNCSNSKYSNVFSGNTLKIPRVIVDFVPFGYDLDKLEVRLYEGADIVDAFVIYESPLTQTGRKKPLYFDHVRNSSRFKHFEDKIIYLKANRNALDKYIAPDHNGRLKLWKMEGSMRYEIIRLFQNISEKNEYYERKLLILKAMEKDNALGIQNDADEMILRDV